MRQLSEFLLRLAQGAMEKPVGEFRDWALAEASVLVPFDSCVWLMGSWIDGQPVAHTVHLHKQEDGFVESWMRFQHEDRLMRDVTAHSNISFNVDVAAEYAGTDIYNLHCKRHGIAHIVATGMIDPDTRLLNSMCLYRADANHPFSERERAVNELIFQHLVEAARTNLLANLLSAPLRGGSNALAACEASGLLLMAMPSFVELCRRDFPAWIGPFLPQVALDQLCDGSPGYVGSNIVISRIQMKDVYVLRGRLKVLADTLSERELQIARQIAEGCDYKTIAMSLVVSLATVKTHVNNIFRKLGINDKTMVATELNRMSA